MSPKWRPAPRLPDLTVSNPRTSPRFNWPRGVLRPESAERPYDGSMRKAPVHQNCDRWWCFDIRQSLSAIVPVYKVDPLPPPSIAGFSWSAVHKTHLNENNQRISRTVWYCAAAVCTFRNTMMSGRLMPILLASFTGQLTFVVFAPEAWLDHRAAMALMRHSSLNLRICRCGLWYCKSWYLLECYFLIFLSWAQELWTSALAYRDSDQDESWPAHVLLYLYWTYTQKHSISFNLHFNNSLVLKPHLLCP